MKTCTKSMFLLKTTISCRFSLVFDTFFIENRCPSQAKSMFLLKALIFFLLLRDLSPLDPGAHWPDVLRSSSSWLSQICLDRLHSQMDNGQNHAEYESGTSVSMVDRPEQKCVLLEVQTLGQVRAKVDEYHYIPYTFSSFQTNM